jgi:hypothetical protein
MGALPGSVPPLLSLRITTTLLGLTYPTGARVLPKSLTRVPIAGVTRYATAEVEKLIGRSITLEEYVHAVAKTRGTIINAVEAPEMDTASSLTKAKSNGAAAA